MLLLRAHTAGLVVAQVLNNHPPSYKRNNRCYHFWMDFLKCMQEEGADDAPKCKPLVDDYRECLHHRKFWERRLTVERERRRQEREGGGGGAVGHKAH